MVPLKLWVFLYLCLQIYTMSSLMSRQLFWQWYDNIFLTTTLFSFKKTILYISLDWGYVSVTLIDDTLEEKHSESIQKNKQKKLKWYCHNVKNKRGCSWNPWVFVFLMARPQRSSPLQLRPCWYYWSKAIQTHMMPSGVNVNNRINVVLLHVNTFCSFV